MCYKYHTKASHDEVKMNLNIKKYYLFIFQGSLASNEEIMIDRMQILPTTPPTLSLNV